ncbi:hypothetical protein V2J09_022725, partial [Rumex salicifolius]
CCPIHSTLLSYLPSSSIRDPKAGVAVYKPKSYEVLVSDAANCLAFALDDGKTRLEIDFPPLPTSISSYKVFPNKPEKRRASQLFKTAIDMVILHCTL